ncbi:hypothetical protein AGMMS49925_07210 [Deltaproteobacteria bacterium]|nr:hypothetical protein AGMMS49925_07210 [Deltaproteobacteria bacterium]
MRVDGAVRTLSTVLPKAFFCRHTDHHDKAYAWAERRKLEDHSKAGAAQLVEVMPTAMYYGELSDSP